VDHYPLEKVAEEIEKYQNNVEYVVHKHSFRYFQYKYVNSLLLDERVKMAFYCFDSHFDVFNSPTMLMYRKYLDKVDNELNYYILLICTIHQLRGQGYGTKLMDEFVKRVKEENKDKEFNKVKIILSSLEEAVLFYENYGFRWTRESLTDHPFLMGYEKYEEKKEYFILELVVDK
jgi:GNAT superfamily N-acetyltransferase